MLSRLSWLVPVIKWVSASCIAPGRGHEGAVEGSCLPGFAGSSGNEDVVRRARALSAERVALLAAHGVTLQPIDPIGARVSGWDLRVKPTERVLDALQREMAAQGFLVFAGQGILSGDESVTASEYWGGREIHSTHGVHAGAPNKHIFRLSNDPRVGIVGVGPQWHNDGSFVAGTFSHVGYHIVRVPEGGGDTHFAHQGIAFQALPAETQKRWSRLTSVNSNSGVLHPLVHEHPISGLRSVWLHLGMTGAVVEVVSPAEPGQGPRVRLLERDELVALLREYNDLLDAGFERGYAISYPYKAGDFVFIDNLAVAHRAAPEAHEGAERQGLRILHRTTVKATRPLAPEGLPQKADIGGPNPFGQGVWQAGGVGFRWDDSARMQN